MTGSASPISVWRGVTIIWTIALSLAITASAQAAIGGFEGGDGDQASSCLVTTDWACLPDEAVLGASDGTGVLDDGFVGGAKESQPDTWQYAPGAIQAKADLLGAWMSVASDAGGNTFLNLAFARAGANGDTYAGIELNQKATTWQNSVGTTIPCRTDGDILVSFEASNQPDITLYRWVGSAGPAACPDGRTGTWDDAAALNTSFEAAMNTAPVVNELEDPSVGTPMPVETFGEASLDLGAVADAIDDAQPGACSYYRHMSVKTRSAAEIDSALQDWTSGSRLFARACETPDPGGDVTAPAAPSITAPAAACVRDVTVSGTSEPGSTVTVYDGASPVGFAVADASGDWSLGVTGLTDGSHDLSAEATDAAGNTSARSAAVSVDVDGTAPAAPTLQASRGAAGEVSVSGTAEAGAEITILEGATVVATATAGPDGAFNATVPGADAGAHTYVATAGDGCHTSPASAPASVGAFVVPDVTPPAAPVVAGPAASCALPVVVSGTAEPGATVTVYAGASSAGSTVAAVDGAWQLPVNGLSDGQHALTAEATDAAGNISARSTALTLDLDATAPAAPVLDAAWSGDGSVTLSGTAEPGLTVTIREGAAVVATVTAAGDGTFSTTLNGVVAADHAYVATAADDCHISPQSAAAQIADPSDKTAPTAPVIAGPASSCTLPVVLSGTAESGATVAVYEGATSLGSTTADAGGAWELSLNGLADGVHALSADATDAAGNTSSRSAAVELRVDTAAPAAPVVEAKRVDPQTVELSGTAEPLRTVTVREGDDVRATVQADADGAYKMTVEAADVAAHDYSVTAADACRASAAGTASVAAKAALDPAVPADVPAPEVTPEVPTLKVLPEIVQPTDALPPYLMGATATSVASCIGKPFRAYLPMTSDVRSARFMVDGRTAATVRKPDARGHFFAVIDPRKYSTGAHKLTARVTFKDPKRSATTVSLRFRRCDDCQSRRAFRIRVPNLANGERAVRARVYVNGKRVKVVTGKRLRARVVLTGLPRGTYKVEIITRTNRGRVHRSERRYRTCVGKTKTQ